MARFASKRESSMMPPIFTEYNHSLIKQKEFLQQKLFLFKTHYNGTVHFKQGIFNDKNGYTSMITHQMITYQHLIFHFYDLPHPNHRGECSIPGILQLIEVAP